MKKIIGFLVAVLFISTVSFAQTSTKSRYSVALDTVTNTGVKSMNTGRVAGVAQTVTITTVNTALTGTLAGVARLWGSLDGVDYSRVRTTQLQGLQVDSAIVDANHKVYTWVVLNSPYQYYQIQTTGIGTTTFTVKGKYVAH